MKGFKSIEELSLKSCYNFLSSEENKKHPLYSAIAERYQEMLQDLEKQDASDYAACKTIENYNAYINKFSDNSIAPYYKAKHIDEAKNTIEELFWNAHKKSVGGCKEYLSRYPKGKYTNSANNIIRSSKKTKWLVLGIVFIVLVIAFFIGYKPVNSLSVSETSLSFGKWGGTENVHISTNVSSNAVDVRCSGAGFDTEEGYGFDFKVSAGANEGDSRTGTVKVTAYATLYGMRMGKGKSVVISLSQESGLANRLSVSAQAFNVGKWGGECHFKVNTDGVKIDTKTQNDWMKIQKINDYEYCILLEKNPSGIREGEVVVSSGEFNKTIQINQSSGLASIISIDRSEINCDKDGTSPGKGFSIKVKTDGTAYTVSKPYWIDVTTYDDHFFITVEATDDVREGSVVVRSNNDEVPSQSLKIYQDGNPTTFSVEESSLSFDTESDYDDVNLNNNSHQSIHVTTDKRWLDAWMRGKYVRISCERNDGEPRNGKVILSCGNRECTITVKQKGWIDCTSCNGRGYKGCDNYTVNGVWNMPTLVRYERNPRTGEMQHVWPCQFDNWGNVTQWCNCSKCGGSGKVECSRCGGRGRIKKN